MSNIHSGRRREEARGQRSVKRADRNAASLNGSPQRRNGHEKRDSDTEVPDNQCMDLFPSKLDHLHLSDQSRSSQYLLSPKSPARKKTCCRHQVWSPVNTGTRTCLSEEEFPSLSPPNNIKSRKSETPGLSKSWADIMDEEDAKEEEKSVPMSSSKRRLVMSDVSNTKESISKPNPRAAVVKQILTDEHRLRQRQKQIDFGKNTASYGRYLSLVPRSSRTKTDPSTPDKFQACSARSWGGQVKVWRRQLHFYDPPETTQEFTEGQYTCWSKKDSDTESTSSDANRMDIDDDNVSSRSGSACDFDDIFRVFDLDASLVDDGLPL